MESLAACASTALGAIWIDGNGNGGMTRPASLTAFIEKHGGSTAHLGGGLLSRVGVPGVWSGVVCPSAGDENVWALGQCWSQFCVSREPAGSIPRPHSLASRLCPLSWLYEWPNLWATTIAEWWEKESRLFVESRSLPPANSAAFKVQWQQRYLIIILSFQPKTDVAEQTQRAIQSAWLPVIRMEKRNCLVTQPELVPTKTLVLRLSHCARTHGRCISTRGGIAGPSLGGTSHSICQACTAQTGCDRPRPAAVKRH